ncbi:MAG TPA: hypothetical protein VEK57_26550 [Thermoanaerobaculia bacterium]|nr:hypothetical protein [Thermoanaerobaculia bacterium]
MTRFLRTLPLALLLPVLAHASLIVGPAVPVADPAERVGSYRPQNGPSVAWNGGHGLVVWRARVGLRDHVLANHVDEQGKPLEAAPLFLFADGQTLFTRVVPLGSRFLVVWQYVDNTAAATRAALVDRDGSIRHLGAIGVPPFHPNDVASNGSTALITGSSGDPDYQSVLVWIDSEGRVISTKTFGSTLMIGTRAVSDDAFFFVVAQQLVCGTYTCEHTFYLIRAEGDGTSGEARVIRTVKDSQSFDYSLTGVAASRDRLLVTFQEPHGFMAATLFDHDGNTAGGPFPLEDQGASGAPVAAGSDGSSFVVAYPHAVFHSNAAPETTTRLRRIGTSGSSEPTVLADHGRTVALAWTGSVYLLASGSPHPGISVMQLPPSGVPDAGTPEHILSHAPNQQDVPSAVSDGTQLFTAWEEFFPAEGLWKVKYGRTGAEGHPLDGRGSLIAPSTASQRNARAVFDGSRYLVLWTETTAQTTTIHARRVSRDGAPAGDAFMVAPAYCTADFDAVRHGDRVLVAHLSAGCGGYELQSVLVTAVEASDTSSASTVVAEKVTHEAPAIESAGTSALIVWTESVARGQGDPCPYPQEYCPPKELLRGAVIGDGTVQRVSIAEGGLMVNREAQLAWNGQHYLVAWLGAADVNRGHGLYTRLFTVDGQPASGAHPLAADAPSNYPKERRGSVVATPSGFLVAWVRSPYQTSLSVWRVAPNGAPVDIVERAVEIDATDLRAPHLVSGPGAKPLLVYSVSGPDEVYLGHNRIVSRSLGQANRTRAVRH